MALTKEQKQKVVEDLKKKIEQQKSVVFIDFSKVNSKDTFILRKKLKETGCVLKVAKKTLLKIAFGDKNKEIWQKIKDNSPGQLAVIFGTKDEMAPAKITQQFVKENENVKILGGIFESKFIDKAEVVILSAIPSKEELLAKLVGTLSAPVSGLVNVFRGNIKGLVYVLSRIKT
ncbi:50S ribosomal protein L10 [Patescibacteria group bacterium]|nr:50S ribosomal protein L10 [Patescibacteria group bacterium]